MLSGMCWWLMACSRPARHFLSHCHLEPSCASSIFSGPGRSPEARSAFRPLVTRLEPLSPFYSQLALQTKFHGPLAYPPPYPPRPIFQRIRPPELSAVEIGASDAQYETSFYKNTYAMVGPPPVYLPLMLTRPLLPVHGCDDVPSAVLLSCDQAQYHSLHVDSVGGLGSSVVRARPARSPDASARS